MSIDWNLAAETTLTTGLGMVPEVGSILSALVTIFWPQSQEDVWSEVQQQVEQLVQQQISAFVSQEVTDDLSGLQNALNDYISAVATGDLPNISAQWIVTSTAFDEALPHFQSNGYQLLLLPLFAQFANLNLSLLRDGVLFGSGWGWNANYVASTATKLTNSVSNFYNYASQTWTTGYQNCVQNAPSGDPHNLQPFQTINAFTRQMTVSVLDFMNLWQYFDASKYPNSVDVYLGREIYSDPVGTADNSGPINLPSAPTQPPTQIAVWAWDRIDAVQLTYPAGAGPGGVTQTARMGDQSGGSDSQHGGVFNKVSNNPVTVAAGYSGSILNAFEFTFADGTSSGKLGGNYPGGNWFSFSYDGEILSSIHINGVSESYGSADCAVFGFKFAQSTSANVDALRREYVASPRSVSVQTLASRAGVKTINPDELAGVASQQNWDIQRQQYQQVQAAHQTKRAAGA